MNNKNQAEKEIQEKIKKADASMALEEMPFKAKQQPSKELSETLKELDYMESHPEQYKVYHDVDKMFEDILN